MTQNFFKHKKLNKNKLLSYGFSEYDNKYVYSCYITEGQMELFVTVKIDGTVSTRLIDISSNEEYILHLVKNASGTFIGKVRSEYENILSDIADKCFDEEIFKFPQTKRVIAYFRNKYGNELEHLWEDAPDNAIVRRRDNRKWYAVILTVSRKQLGIDSEEKVEIIDLHALPENIPYIVDGVKYFPGFHMNKKHWITVCLDESVPDEELFEKIDESYALGKK